MVIRPDALEKKGGDYIQMISIMKYLKKLGIEVSWTNDLPDNKHIADIIHIFNLQTAKFTYEWVKYAKKNKIPVFLSPIYWKTSPYNSKFFLYLLKSDRWIIKNYFRSYFNWYEKLSKKFKLQRKILKKCDFLILTSFMELNHLEKKFSLKLKNKSGVVYNGIDEEIFPPLKFYEKENFIIQVGAIYPTKNQATTIKSLWDLEIDIFFIGRIEDKNYFNYCKKLVSKRKGKTFFLGELPYESLIPYYQKAKVHILPSFKEVAPLSNLEAGAMGCNIVTTTESCCFEYFGKDAFYCKPFDINGIRESVLRAIKMDFPFELAKKIRNEFTWKNAAIKTLNYYNDFLNNL